MDLFDIPHYCEKLELKDNICQIDLRHRKTWRIYDVFVYIRSKRSDVYKDLEISGVKIVKDR